MAKRPHPDYYYKIKSDFSYSQIHKNELHYDNEDVIYIVKTEFNYIMGADYTYSKHSIYTQNFQPSYLRVENTQEIGNYTFVEYCGEAHCATIKMVIRDSIGEERELRFHHLNGIGWNYTEIDGAGITSIIKSLKLMAEVDKWKSWKAYDNFQDFIKLVTIKLHHHLPKDVIREIIPDILNVDKNFCIQAWNKYAGNDALFDEIRNQPSKFEKIKNIINSHEIIDNKIKSKN